MKTRIREKLHFRTSMWVPIVAIVRSMPTFIPTLRPVPNNNNPLLPLSLSLCVCVCPESPSLSSAANSPTRCSSS